MRHSRQHAPQRTALHDTTAILTLSLAASFIGCAAPGPPKPPSLHLPERARKLTAERTGDLVVLRFDAPSRTSDGQLLTGPVNGSLCRAESERGRCVPVPVLLGESGSPGGMSIAVPADGPEGPSHTLVWADRLPPGLSSGAPHTLVYKVELRNAAGKSAGPSDPVFAAAGDTPPPVEMFHVEGSRLGAVLRWAAIPADAHATDVLVERTPVNAAKTEAPPAPPPEQDESRKHHHKHKQPARRSPQTQPAASGKAAQDVWLTTEHGKDAALDSDALDGEPYRYCAERRSVVTLGGRELELRSAPTISQPFTWRPVYPPPAPRDLSAAAFTAPVGLAVDLVWQPVTVENLAGYRVYREELPGGERQALTPALLRSPAFHDETAKPGVRYRYSVTAVDRFGNESPAITAEAGGDR